MRYKIFPHPFFMILFLIFWLFLNGITYGDFLFGIILGFLSAHILNYLEIETLDLRKKYLFIKLFFHVFKDAFTAHVKMFYLILKSLFCRNLPEDLFIIVPLYLKNPTALALLNCFISLSPGAIWVAYNAKESTVLIHLLDKKDEESFLKNFHNIYEETLLQIFSMPEKNFIESDLS